MIRFLPLRPSVKPIGGIEEDLTNKAEPILRFNSSSRVPMQYPFVEWGSHTTFDEVITGNQSTIPCPTYNNTIAIIDRALCI